MQNYLSEFHIDELNLSQIKIDIQDSLNVLLNAKHIPPVIYFNLLPYFALIAHSSYKYLEGKNILSSTHLKEEEINKIFNMRLKTKLYEKDKFASIMPFLYNVDLLNTLYFNNIPRFKFIGKIFELDNLGCYLVNNRCISNTHSAYYIFQNKELKQKFNKNDFILSKSKIDDEVKLKMVYKNIDYSLDVYLGENGKAFQFSKLLGNVFISIYNEIFSDSTTNNTITNSFKRNIKIVNRDYNTNKLPMVFNWKKPLDEKLITLFLLHLFCTLNFNTEVLNDVIPHASSLNLKIKYLSLNYVNKNLKSLYNYLQGNNLLDNMSIGHLNTMIKLSDNLVNKDFANYLRHSDFRDDKTGIFLISKKYFDPHNIYFGLIETCFKCDYNEFQNQLNDTIAEISNILDEWIFTDFK